MKYIHYKNETEQKYENEEVHFKVAEGGVVLPPFRSAATTGMSIGRDRFLATFLQIYCDLI